MAWTAQDFKDPSTYTHYLSQDEVLEVDNALKHFKGMMCRRICLLPVANLSAWLPTAGLGLWGGDISPHNFPLPTLSNTLAL